MTNNNEEPSAASVGSVSVESGDQWRWTMCDDESVMWPSTLPPCSVSISLAQALQIAMAQQMDETWKQAAAEGFAYKQLDWTPTKPTHHKDGPKPTAMSFDPPTESK